MATATQFVNVAMQDLEDLEDAKKGVRKGYIWKI